MESIFSACLSAPDSKNTNIAWRQIYFRHHMDPMYSASPARSAWCLVSFFAARSDLLPSGETPVHQKTTGGLRFSLSSKVLTKLKKRGEKGGAARMEGSTQVKLFWWANYPYTIHLLYTHYYLYIQIIWSFPKLGTPNHPFLDWFSKNKINTPMWK